ncbi:MAG: hypothetical protein HQL11_04510, partial [Candidatus Omnitrophica bacterium]|nr:hypothetical protein [Candidatus Omnitrophota bacterium]
PVIVLLWMFAAAGLAAGMRRLGRPAAALAVAGTLLWGNAALAGNVSWREVNFLRPYAFSDLFKAQLHWMAVHVPAGEPVAVGLAFSSYSFYLEGKIRQPLVGWPKLDSMDELTAYLEARGVRYGILDLATAFYQNKIFGDYIAVSQRDGMVIRRPLPGCFREMPGVEGLSRMVRFFGFDFSGEPGA